MRKRVYAQVQVFFADLPPGALDTHEIVDGDHGRIEIGRHAVCHDVTQLFLDRRYPDEPHFPGLVMIDMVESEIERGQDRARAALSSLFHPARCRDHHAGPLAHREPPALVLDIVFHDGLAWLCSGYRPETMTVEKHVAVNLLRRATASTNLKTRCELAGWDLDDFATLVRQIA